MKHNFNFSKTTTENKKFSWVGSRLRQESPTQPLDIHVSDSLLNAMLLPIIRWNNVSTKDAITIDTAKDIYECSNSPHNTNGLLITLTLKNVKMNSKTINCKAFFKFQEKVETIEIDSYANIEDRINLSDLTYGGVLVDDKIYYYEKYPKNYINFNRGR